MGGHFDPGSRTSRGPPLPGQAGPLPRRLTYSLSPSLIADHIGAGVLCLAGEGLGRSYRLHAERPGASLNRFAYRDGSAVEWRADGPVVYGPQGVVDATPPALVRVDIMGALEQRAGFQDECGAWTDGHDAVTERLLAALEMGDVLLVVDSPGGAAAGLQQGVERVLRAKEHHGRRVTVFADEMIGSAAMWWSAAIGDEIFLPPAGEVGSIGARGEHTSIAGLLAKEGIEKTYFADPPDKIAFAPEFPLTPVGAARGNRDVKLAAGAFRAAVCAGPIGILNGLTPEFLIELGADMLTGEAAVGVLANEVASFDDVVAYALTLASSNSAKDINDEAAKAVARTAKTRAAARAPRRAA